MKALFFVIIAFASANATPQPIHTIDFDHYWTLDEINHYLDELNEEYPDFVELKVVGKSFEGREIRGIQIGNEKLSINETEVVEITAGLSSRDWIATMAAVNLIHELVEHRDHFSQWIDRIVWFIIPVSNPDGFFFSFTEGVS
jgi:murein tripeptide amidase MpaA